jgi:hypothetical protein
MKYYPITKKWAKIKPHIENKIVQDILVQDFNKYTMGLWGKPFTKGMKPFDFESCDWHCERRGRRPEYWDYVKHAACHWLVNFNLELAKLVEPKKEWRIVTTQKHSTVWDGGEILFDFNFSALQIDPDEAFEMANKKHLPIGKKLTVYHAEYWGVTKKKK